MLHLCIFTPSMMFSPAALHRLWYCWTVFGLFLFLKHFSFSFHLPHLHKGTHRLRSQYLQTTSALCPRRSAVRSCALMRRAWPGCERKAPRSSQGRSLLTCQTMDVCSGSRLRRQIISELLAICWWPDDICFGLYVYISHIDELHICFFSAFWCKYHDCGKCAVYVLIFDSWNRATGFSHSEQCDIGIRAVTNYNPTGSDHSPHRCTRLPKKEHFTASYLWYLWIYTALWFRFCCDDGNIHQHSNHCNTNDRNFRLFSTFSPAPHSGHALNLPTIVFPAASSVVQFISECRETQLLKCWHLSWIACSCSTVSEVHSWLFL